MRTLCASLLAATAVAALARDGIAGDGAVEADPKNGILTYARQFYTDWTFDPVNQRYVALYMYRPTPAMSYKAQLAVTYPNTCKVYFFNLTTAKYWGCCDIPSPGVTEWSRLENGAWVPLAGTPPIPESKDNIPFAEPPPHPPGVVPPPPVAAVVPPPGVVPHGAFSPHRAR